LERIVVGHGGIDSSIYVIEQRERLVTEVVRAEQILRNLVEVDVIEAFIVAMVADVGNINCVVASKLPLKI
jgi:hypothetical protein